jgi:uncharacterized protein involved in response to NO
MTPAPAGFALWSLGFRPFYLLASAFAAVSMLFWIGHYGGVLPGPPGGSQWHAHEMLYGYTMAVVAGFLLTAVPNWTGRPTPKGAALVALAALWVAGRVLVLTPFATASALANAAFPLAVAVAIGIPLVRARNRRNYFFVALLVLQGFAVLAFHLAQARLFAWPPGASLQLGLDVVLFIMAVVGGRVIPMFTNNGVPGARATRHRLVENGALGGVLLLVATDVLPVPGGVVAAIAWLVAAAHAVRLLLWQPWLTARAPLVWVLHLAYAWIVASLVLRGLAALGLVSPLLAVHALTIGAIGGMTIGMMTRTARGHTGRALVADPGEVLCFVLVAIAAVVRVFGAMAPPGFYLASVVLSGACWSAAFGLFAAISWPALTRPRTD